MIVGMSDGGERPDVHQRLERASAARHEAAGTRSRLEAATSYAVGTAARVDEARAKVAAEDRDVARLESLSWPRILTVLRGNQATELEREQAERDAARYTLADSEVRDAAARRDVAALRAQLEALGDVDGEFRDALAAKEEWLLDHDRATGFALTRIAERRGVLTAEDKEGREAFDAGSVARQHLLHARDLLASARSWSNWDTFGGGGMFTDMMKYDKLDQVSAALRQADVALGSFSRELADLRLGGVEAVNLDGMTQAFDVWFDNIFTDLRVRSRIQDAEARVVKALGQVETTLNDLSARGRAIASELTDLGAERERLLA